MKVILIYPPALNLVDLNIPFEVDKESGSHPPLGLLYIAAYLENNSDVQVEILDAQAEGTNYDDMQKVIETQKPDVVGIQAMTFNMKDVLLTARIVKQINNGILVCLGGPHINIYPNETIGFPEIDFLVLGEGEITFTELVKGISDGSDLARIKGIVFERNGRIINTGKREPNLHLDDLPFPDRHLVAHNKYYSSVAKSSQITTMITSRGCPYKCIFCDRPHLGKRFRARSALNVVDEMEACTQMGIKELYLFDDTFTVNKTRVLDVCREILRRNLRVAWTIRARVDTVDEEILTALKAAGCYRIHYGVESGVPEILKILKKGTNLRKIEEVFKLTRDKGIITVGYFMIGSPGETRSHVLQTIEFAKNIKVDYAQFSITTPYPATELYYMGLEKGILKEDTWKRFAENPLDHFVPPVWEEHLSKEELIVLLRQAYHDFYMRPSYILKRFLELKSWNELSKKARVALALRRI